MRGPLVTVIQRYSSIANRLASSPWRDDAGRITSPWIRDFSSTPIFKEYHEWYRTGDPKLYQFIYSFLTYGKKLKFKNDELNAAAFRGWLEVEKGLSVLELPSNIMAGMAKITRALVSDYRRGYFSPKFGPKAVAEKGIRGTIAKANNLAYDAVLSRAFFTGHFASYGLSGELGYAADKVLPDPDAWRLANDECERISLLSFVDKDVGKARSICMEPNTIMFFQQGVRNSLQSAMESGLARRFINVHDQERNRNLAEYGSRSGRIDTIDLSSASDSVSIELVRRIFPRILLYDLLATRTSIVRLPTGHAMRVMKFAPMGSALCFPVQCLVFATVVIYAAMQYASGLDAGDGIEVDSPWLEDVERSCGKLFQEKTGKAPLFQLTFEPASIYGDDICVDHRLTQHVTHLLGLLGFHVNEGKSFVGVQAFRESCGGYYLNGEDVKPLFYRVGRHGKVLDPNCVESLIAGINQAGKQGYRNLQRCLFQFLSFAKIRGSPLRKGRNCLYFTDVENETYGIFSTRPRNDHLARKVHKDWQVDIVNCIVLKSDEIIRPKPFEKAALERYLYIRWWGSRAGVVHVDGKSAAPRYDTSSTRLVRRWIPDRR